MCCGTLGPILRLGLPRPGSFENILAPLLLIIVAKQIINLEN